MTEFSRTCRDDGWFARYRNDSRPWLTSTVGMLPKKPMSTMKESFQPYQDLPKPAVGRRRELLQKFLVLEVAKEIKEELMREPEDGEKYTEYEDNFKRDGFQPSSFEEHTEKDLENQLQFPLYIDAPRTAWLDKVDSLAGSTESPKSKLTSIFHRNSSFTKPIDQVLDQQKPGTIGYV